MPLLTKKASHTVVIPANAGIQLVNNAKRKSVPSPLAGEGYGEGAVE